VLVAGTGVSVTVGGRDVAVGGTVAVAGGAVGGVSGARVVVAVGTTGEGVAGGSPRQAVVNKNTSSRPNPTRICT
jgi:hypothetical protein